MEPDKQIRFTLVVHDICHNPIYTYSHYADSLAKAEEYFRRHDQDEAEFYLQDPNYSVSIEYTAAKVLTPYRLSEVE